MDSVDGPECDDGSCGDSDADGYNDLHGDGHGCERMSGYGDGNGDGWCTAFDHIDRHLECVFILRGHGICDPDLVGERLEPDGGHHGECSDGL